MKKQIVILGALVVGIMAWSGCTKEDLIGSMTATVNGTSWTATGQAAVAVQNRVVITGSTASSTIVLSPNGKAAGTYNTDVFEGNVQPFVYTPNLNTPQNTYAGSSGSIVITSYSNNRLSGTFNVSATNATPETINITGEFKNILIN